MFPATVIDVNNNGTVSVMLDDAEIFDIEVSEPVSMGDQIMVSPDQISTGQSLSNQAYNPEEEAKPTFDW